MTGRFDWMDDALCAQVGTDIFFAAVGENDAVSAAKQVCARCVVKAPCAVWLATGFTHNTDRAGIAGGLTPARRRRLRTQLADEQTGRAA